MVCFVCRHPGEAAVAKNPHAPGVAGMGGLRLFVASRPPLEWIPSSPPLLPPPHTSHAKRAKGQAKMGDGKGGWGGLDARLPVARRRCGTRTGLAPRLASILRICHLCFFPASTVWMYVSMMESIHLVSTGGVVELAVSA